MDRLTPIPTPIGQRWREFRIRVVPFIVFTLAASAVVFIWRENLAAPTLVGEVETTHANISSPKGGKLFQLNVTRLQRVKAGDVVAQVVTTDPDVLESSLAVIQAEIGLMRLNLEPVLGQQRFAVTYDRLRLDWMEQRVLVATARVRLELADAELRRAEELFRDKVISQQLLDTARSTREALDAEVKERSHLVAEQEQKLKSLGLAGEGNTYPAQTSPEDVMQASIKVQEQKLRLTEAELSPVKLVVPMNGTVSAVHHRSGEAVVAGEAIVTLTALTSDRIIGYVRQPLAFEPKVGMRVEVRARSLQRCVTQAEILEVGTQMEPITAALSPVADNHLRELGLPVLVSLPAPEKFRPGELVDLRIIGANPSVIPPLDTERALR